MIELTQEEMQQLQFETDSLFCTLRDLLHDPTRVGLLSKIQSCVAVLRSKGFEPQFVRHPLKVVVTRRDEIPVKLEPFPFR